MALLKVNAQQDMPRLASGSGALVPPLAQALGAPGPVVILLHGYKFSPDVPDHCPHNHIFSLTPPRSCWKAVSWPRLLGFGQPASRGVCIGFGWHARGSIWSAYDQAQTAAVALARLIRQIRQLDPQRPVHIVAHSLGARVALRALSHCHHGDLDRLILIAAAEFESHAARALNTPAGQSAEVINITSRENDPYDKLVETLIAPHRLTDRALSQGLKQPQRNWLDVQIDNPEALRVLNQMGYPIAAPDRRICHWSGYLRPGIFDFYTDLLHSPGATPLSYLRDALPRAACPRWSRLFAAPTANWPLPLTGNQPS